MTNINQPGFDVEKTINNRTIKYEACPEFGMCWSGKTCSTFWASSGQICFDLPPFSDIKHYKKNQEPYILQYFSRFQIQLKPIQFQNRMKSWHFFKQNMKFVIQILAVNTLRSRLPKCQFWNWIAISLVCYLSKVEFLEINSVPFCIRGTWLVSSGHLPIISSTIQSRESTPVLTSTTYLSNE